MTKEQLISLYPSTESMYWGFTLAIGIFVAGLFVLIISRAVEKPFESSSLHGVLVCSGSGLIIVSLLVGMFSTLTGLDKIESAKEKWNTIHYPAYVESLPKVDLEVKDLVQKIDGTFEAVVINSVGLESEVKVNEVEIVKGKEASRAEGKYIEGLEKYGVISGYKDVVVYIPKTE